ncbi:MAG TPA: hypothetical protein VL242_40550 [Sorangium sp.]|nr:hypothetical protein [Sorangium sp.]
MTRDQGDPGDVPRGRCDGGDDGDGGNGGNEERGAATRQLVATALGSE